MHYQVIESPLGYYVDAFLELRNAKVFAESRRAITGKHYNIQRIETVWSTQSLDDAIAEGDRADTLKHRARTVLDEFDLIL